VAEVSLRGVGKVFEDGTRAVSDLNLSVADGEFMVLVGPSGCGKTTALRMVAGLEEVTEGEVAIGDRVVNDLEPRERDIAMVFQNYALYPHMSVFDNIAFGLRMQRVPKREIEQRVEQIAGILGLRELLRRKPRQLSGGQRQRVAMGRAIVREPKVFLMDEPLSNLDAKLRVQMRAEVARIQRELGTTTIYVTHDQVEAMTMGDRVCVLRKGVLQQVDMPERLYARPANLFVASFIGSPAMNLVEAELVARDGAMVCRVGEQELPCPDRSELRRYGGRTVALGIRPEHLREPAREGEPRLRGTVTVTELLGSELLAHLEVAGEPVLTADVLEVAADVDAAIAEEVRSGAAEHRVTVVARLDAETRPRGGETFDVAIDPDRFYFFDLETGRALGAADHEPAPAGA
jgi:multiple sugar transport system ATP-binding protein